VLPLYDNVIRDSLSATLNVDLTDERWHQASLPVRWGGLGVRSVIMLAPSAYLASAACTMELTSSLLPAYLRDSKDSGIAPATSAWLHLARYLPSNTQTILTPASMVQRSSDDPCCKVQSDTLLDAAVDHVGRSFAQVR
jgi:hypothetical protein